MNLTRLLNQAYLLRTDLPPLKWTKRKPYEYPTGVVPPMSHYNPDDMSYLLTMAHNETMDPFLFDKKLIRTDDDLYETIFSQVEKVETSLLVSIHNLLRVLFIKEGKTVFTNTQFKALSLPEQCHYLEMGEYLLDRNINDLYYYETFLVWEEI